MHGRSFRILFFISFCFILFACASSSPKIELAQLHLKIGTNHLVAGNFPEALKSLLTAETYDNKDPVIQNNLGLTYFMRERNDLAEKHIKKAIQLEPKYTEAKNNLARLYIDFKRYNEAEPLVNECLKDLTFPQPAKSFINLGLLRFNQGKFEASKEAFAKALSFESENCLAQTYYGRNLLELNQLESSGLYLDKATVTCSSTKFDEPIYYAAISYYRFGDEEKAKQRLESIRNPQSKYFEKAKGMLKLLEKK